MPYVIQRRQIGDYLAPAPYQGSANRYVKERSNARTFARYVDAFNACHTNEMVVEL